MGFEEVEKSTEISTLIVNMGPSDEDINEYPLFSHCLAGASAHQVKSLLEVLVGFLQRIPS